MKSIYSNPFAQSRIFKEISEEISTQVKPIMQDNVLVGYRAFTRLEEASADSFNYRLSIMDENLNDIGKVNFRQGILDLQTVSFEQHVLCLGFIQTSLASIETIRTQRGYNKVLDAANSSHLLLQFVDLDGKILNTWYKEVSLNMGMLANRSLFSSSIRLTGFLKYGMQLKNVSNRGFAFFYGDEAKQDLLMFDLKGTLTEEEEVPTHGSHFYLQTSPRKSICW